MRARYLGNHAETTLFGIHFPKGVYVAVNDSHAQNKIRNNSHFEVEQIDAEEVAFVEVPVTRSKRSKEKK